MKIKKCYRYEPTSWIHNQAIPEKKNNWGTCDIIDQRFGRFNH